MESETTREIKHAEREIRHFEKDEEKLKLVAYAAIAISVIALILSVVSLIHSNSSQPPLVVYRNGSGTQGPTNLTAYNITGVLIDPALFANSTLATSPVITKEQPFGARLTGINAPLNSSQLSVINNASDSFYQKAALAYLNNSLGNSVFGKANKVKPFVVNGKPTVIYFGATTCPFCAENRWAMALALSRFGSFKALFKGYSALQDGDLPTIFWTPVHYNSTETEFGAFYNSSYINFISIEDAATLYGAFSIQPLSTIAQKTSATNSVPYIDAMKYIIQINNFQGTPYSIWGTSQVGGADAVAFGNLSSKGLQMQNWTHAQVLGLLSSTSSTFSLVDYAAADIYIAMTCANLQGSAPAICSTSYIKAIEQMNGY